MIYLTFAWRYFKAKKSTNAINIIAWVSVIAIAVGTASLIILLSVFNGFEELVKSLYADFYTDIRIGSLKGKTIFLTTEQLKAIKAMPELKSFSLTMEEKALLQNGDFPAIVTVKGVDSNYRRVSGMADKLIRGEYSLGTTDTPYTILGAGIENAIGLQSDRTLLPLTIYLPRKGTTNSADPRQSLSTDNIRAAGAFAIQQDFDNKYAVTNLGFVKRMLDMKPDEYGAAEIMLNEEGQNEKVKKELVSILGPGYLIQNRYQQNRSLYSVMQMEKWVIYGLLSLILVVAAFTMIGALTMLVLEKRKDIQLLKALGMTNALVGKIFLSEGVLLATVGGLSGVILALLTCWFQLRFHLVKLEGNSFLIDYYPVKLATADVML
ncbi:MAG: FtsX-like permease family protein, partial [Chitinophagaceae bacterium]